MPRILDVVEEIWLRFDLRNSRWELHRAEEASGVDIAATWRSHVVSLEERLRELGVDTSKEPEPLTKTLEVWLVVGLLGATIGVAFGVVGYLAALSDLVKAHM